MKIISFSDDYFKKKKEKRKKKKEKKKKAKRKNALRTSKCAAFKLSRCSKSIPLLKVAPFVDPIQSSSFNFFFKKKKKKISLKDKPDIYVILSSKRVYIYIFERV